MGFADILFVLNAQTALLRLLSFVLLTLRNTTKISRVIRYSIFS